MIREPYVRWCESLGRVTSPGYSIGIWIARFARFRSWEVRIELLLVWLVGPAGVMAFAARYWVSALLVRLRKVD